MRSQLLYCNQLTQRPSLSAAGDTYTFPPLLVGKQYSFSLRFLDSINANLSETFPEIRALRANVGFDDLRPSGGTVKIQVGAGGSTGGNTTPALSHHETGDSLKTKLNALADITPHDFMVESDSGSYFVRRTSGAEFTLTVRENLLKPVAFVRVRKWQDSQGWVTELRFIQSPLAFTDSANQVLPPPPYFEPVVDGIDYGGELRQNEVQNLVIPRTFRGEFYVWYKKTAESTPVRTQLFSLADGAAQYKAALDVVMAPDGGVATVTNPDVGKARVEFGGDLVGVNIPLLTVEVPTDGAPPGDWTFLLDLNTIEAWRAVISSPLIQVPISLEIEVPEIEGDEESASKVVPVWDFILTLKRPLTFEGLATAQPVNWLRKPNPKTYLPYNQTQVGAGQFYYSPEELLGDGVETHFEIDHNLGVPALTGICVQDVTDGRVLKESEYEIHVTNGGDSLEIDFVTAPAASSILLTLATPQPLEFFINDLEIEIAQVIGLGAIVTDLTDRLETLEEAILPGVSAGVADSSAVGLVTVIPEIAEVLAFRGTPDEMAALFTEEGVNAAALPVNRAPYMLPAVHDGTLTDPLPTPLPAPAAATVWVAGARTLIPGTGGGIRSAYVENDGHVASDGRSLFVATRDGATNSYYPAAFERTLFAMAINADMLAVKRTLEILFGVQAQLIHATCNAQWVLSIQLGTFSAETEPATVGLNLNAVTWATPVFSQALVLSRMAQSHFFGIRILRTATEFLLDQQKYGNWLPNNAAAPASANFAIRGRLDRFDTENKDNPRGYVAWKLIGSILTGDDGKQTTKPAQARIY